MNKARFSLVLITLSLIFSSYSGQQKSRKLVHDYMTKTWIELLAMSSETKYTLSFEGPDTLLKIYSYDKEGALSGTRDVNFADSRDKIRYRLDYDFNNSYLFIDQVKKGKKHGTCYEYDLKEQKFIGLCEYKKGIKEGKDVSYLPTGQHDTYYEFKSDSMITYIRFEPTRIAR